MKDETRIWLSYAGENLKSSKILLESKLYNPCLQNVQQAVEKALKAIFLERSIKLKRTHDIFELKQILLRHDIQIELSDDEYY
jgi:HEPN domain-containing protein